MREIVAEILTVGDEILYGQITDTNSQWLGEQLGLLGIKVKRKIAVGDDRQELLTIFRESESRADIILITGGLGPTSDDITKPVLCEYFACGMSIHQEVLDHVQQFLNKRNRPMIEINRQQAAVPDKAQVLFNTLGTAPGLWFEKAGKVFIALPGVPHEMKEIMRSSGLPKLKALFKPPVIFHKVIRTIGIGESYLSEQIRDWENALPAHIGLAYLPSLGQVKLRLTAKGEQEEVLRSEVEQLVAKLNDIIGTAIFGYDETELEEAVGLLLKQKGFTLSTAESCTGGGIAAQLTSVPGASSYFNGSVVAYSNTAKMQLLHVKEATLLQHGAVSEETVLEMAKGVRRVLSTDVSISVSGIAGPGGGTEDKPVGTVWIGYADTHKAVAKKVQLTANRALNMKLTAVLALNFLREQLNNL